MKVISKLTVVAWMAVIFWMSSQSGEDSGKLSGGVLQWLIDLIDGSLGMFIKDSETLHAALRKMAHLFAYLILALAVDWALAVETRSKRNHKSTLSHKPTVKSVVLVLAFCAVYAVTDEIHQAFVPGRGPSAFDVIIDTLGSALGLGIKYGFLNIRTGFVRAS